MSVSLGSHGVAYSASAASLASGTLTGGDPTAGSTLVAIVANTLDGSETFTSVTDNAGNTFVEKHSTTNSGTGGKVKILRAVNCATTGSYQATANFSGSTIDLAIWVVEIKGADTTESYDVSAGQYQASPGTGTDAITSGATAATSVNGEFILSVTYRGSGRALHTAGTGFAAIDKANPVAAESQGLTEYLVQSTSGTATGTFTTDFSSNCVTVVAAFKPSGGGGFTAAFRKTLSGLGTGVGKRQVHRSH